MLLYPMSKAYWTFLLISANKFRKMSVLSENCSFQPCAFGRCDVTMQERLGVITGLQVVQRLSYNLVQERGPEPFPFAWCERPKIGLAEY